MRAYFPTRKKCLFWLWIVIAMVFMGAGTVFANSNGEVENRTHSIDHKAVNRTHIAILGDRTGAADQEVFQGIIQEICLLHPDMMINVGDLIEGPQPDAETIDAQWDIIESSFEKVSFPVYYVAGNNDIFSSESRKIFAERTGMLPEYSFDFQGIHFLVLDNSELYEWEQLSEERWNWIAQDLTEAEHAKLKIVVFHKPFWIENFKENVNGKMHQLFLKHGVDRVFSGHYHSYTSVRRDGIEYVMIGSSGGHCGDNAYKGEFMHYGWLTVTTETGNVESECAILKAGSALDQDWLNLDQWMARDNIDSNLLELSRPLLYPDTGQFPVRLKFNQGFGVQDGRFQWKLEGTDWVVSPESGMFDTKQGDCVVDCAAMGTGYRYPLPELVVHTKIDGQDYGYSTKFSPKIAAQVSRLKDDSVQINLDGNPGEVVWAGSQVCELRSFCGESGESCPTDDWLIKLFVNGDRLYIGGKITSAKAYPEVEANRKPERDTAVFMEDCVYLMFWSRETPPRVTQIVLNRIGDVLDQQGQVTNKSAYSRPEMDKTWNAELQYAFQQKEMEWTFEMIIPLTDLGIEPGATDLLFNTLRFQPDKRALALWQNPGTYHPDDAGTLRFTNGNLETIEVKPATFGSDN